MMDGAGDVTTDSGTLEDSFLGATGPYVVEDGEGDVIEHVEDNDDEEDIITDKPLREQDRFLPIANVARIMKKSIPKMGKIARDAKECVQECVSEFVSFITSEASERCHQEKRKTINGEDLLFAMSTLGFDNYVEPLKLFLQKYRESLKGEKILNPADADGVLQELSEDAFSSIPANLLATDQAGQQSVVYTTATYPQLAQLSNFG